MIFRNKFGIPTILGQGAPSFRKRVSAKLLPLLWNRPYLIAYGSVVKKGVDQMSSEDKGEYHRLVPGGDLVRRL